MVPMRGSNLRRLSRRFRRQWTDDRLAFPPPRIIAVLCSRNRCFADVRCFSAFMKRPIYFDIHYDVRTGDY